jgi:hypothetical protein
MVASGDSAKRPTGLGVDPSGGPVIDPTQNVTDLVKAGQRRADDLREADRVLADTRNQHVKELIAIQGSIAELRATFNEKIEAVRAAHAKEMRVAEKDRIDAIRTVDVAAAAASATKYGEQAGVLATQLVATAEALRNQVAAAAETQRNLVATTATAAATALGQVIAPIVADIAAIKSQLAEGKGKQTYTDPLMADMLAQMKILNGTKSEGISSVGTFVMGTLLAISLLVSIGLGIYTVTRPTPQVAYAPVSAQK